MSRTSPVTETVMTAYSDLPAEVQKHLLDLEVFIGDCDGQWTALQTSDENVVLDNGTIDASDAVKAFNGIVAALRSFGLAQSPSRGELHDVIAKALDRDGLTYSGVKRAAEAVQKLYAETLPPSDTSTDRKHTFVDAGFDTCRFCGERESHADHPPFSVSSPDRTSK